MAAVWPGGSTMKLLCVKPSWDVHVINHPGTQPAHPFVVGARDGFEDTMFEAKARQRRGQGQTTSRPRPNYLEAVSRPKPNLFY